MKDLFSKSTPSRLIKQLLLQGMNSVQVYLAVRTEFPNHDDRKLRNLISVIKSKYKRS